MTCTTNHQPASRASATSRALRPPSTWPGAAGTFRDLRFGEGNVDFVACFTTLKGLDCAGPFLIEMWSEKAEDPLAEIAAAKAWIGERLGLGGYI